MTYGTDTSQGAYARRGGPCKNLGNSCHEFPDNVGFSDSDMFRVYPFTIPEYPEFRTFSLPGLANANLEEGGGVIDVIVRENGQETRWRNIREACQQDWDANNCDGENESTSKANWYDSSFDSAGFISLWKGTSIEIASNGAYDEIVGSIEEDGVFYQLRLQPILDLGDRLSDYTIPYNKLTIYRPVFGSVPGDCTRVDTATEVRAISDSQSVRLFNDHFISGSSLNPIFMWHGGVPTMCSDLPIGEYETTLRMYDGLGGSKAFPLDIEVKNERKPGGEAVWQKVVGDFESSSVDDFSYRHPDRDYTIYYYRLTDQPKKYPYDLEGATYEVSLFGGRAPSDFYTYVDGSPILFEAFYD